MVAFRGWVVPPPKEPRKSKEEFLKERQEKHKIEYFSGYRPDGIPAEQV